MLDSASKAFFHLLASSKTLKKIASRYGMQRPSSFARRFIAGERVEEAIEAARALEARGLRSALLSAIRAATEKARELGRSK